MDGHTIVTLHIALHGNQNDPFDLLKGYTDFQLITKSASVEDFNLHLYQELSGSS